MCKIHAMTLILGAVAAGFANSATTTTTVAVTSKLLATCAATATPLAFGAYIPGKGAVSHNSTISVKCTKNRPYTVALNRGATPGATMAQRLMAFGANRLRSNLYTSAAFTTVFGDGTGASKTEAGAGGGLATPAAFTVFGQLPDNAANQAAVPGSYTDTITVTVTY